MNRISALFLCCAFGAATYAAAEEGMWLPSQIPGITAKLETMGLEMDPHHLADLASYPLGAVAKLGGCSASFVSPEGLLITNYHCAYSSIQLNSSVERNLLQKGFLARSREEELPASPNARVYVTVDFKDVTSKVLAGLEGVEGEARSDEIDERRKVMVEECEKEPGSRCYLAGFFGGVEYALVRQLELRDVRLVYAPPLGIGQYGGDVDNFTWPQQKGDFAFFRVYVGPGGKPADRSPDNQAFHPRYHLRVARAPLTENDFVMVVGYPGSTNRYRFSSEVENSFLWRYPRQVQMYETWIRVIQESVKDRPEAALKYAGTESGLNNSLKYARGMVDSFAGSNMLAKKLALEKELAAWIDQDPVRKASYGNVVEELRAAFAVERKLREPDLRYQLATRSELLSAAAQLYQLSREREKPDAERATGYRERNQEKIRQSLERLAHNFDLQVDRAVWKTFLLEYHQLPAGQRVASLDRWFKLVPGWDAGARIDRILDGMYAETRLADKDHLLRLMKARRSDIESSRDPFLKLAVRLHEAEKAMEDRDEKRENALRVLYARYMAALVEHMKSQGQALYPDANSTLRIAFGKVQGYTTSTGIRQRPFTLAEDIVEKDTGKEPFNTPPGTLQVLRTKRFGRYYGPGLGSLPVNFLGTVDVTGGNSGAPTLNSRGELVGLLFDINYEGIISSWDYVPATTRSIHLDIRYALWLLEEIDQAHQLLAEMGVLDDGTSAARTR
jgi:peptidase S46-like protein